MKQIVRTTAAAFGTVGAVAFAVALTIVAFASPARAGTATVGHRSQEVVEYGQTLDAGAKATQSAAGKPFKGASDNDTPLAKYGGYLKNPVVLIVGGGGILILAAWKLALR